ncbi:MAG: c-type cytochrome domain-containing protein, partial [Planctomycetota bacterium]
MRSRCQVLLATVLFVMGWQANWNWGGGGTASGVVQGAELLEVFLNKHCARCHGPQKEEGDIRFDKLSRDFKAGLDTHHWAEALDKINSGAMPPKKEPQPTQEEIAEFVVHLDARLKEGRA